MSLTQTLMNGGMIGTSINPAKYNHDNGALRIATESVEELHDIFMTTYYATEQAELGAVHEGVALENSSYAAVYEGAIRDAFTKVKEFFKKLWAKVKAWFHNVKRFFDSLIMSGKDFVKKYDADIKSADKNLKDFSFKMYKYDDKAIGLEKDNAQAIMLNLTDTVSELTGKVDYKYEGGNDFVKNESELENFKKQCEPDKLAVDFAQEAGLKGVSEVGDIAKASFSYFRSGADSTEDKEDIDVSRLAIYAEVLKNSVALSKVDQIIRKTDQVYTKAIGVVDKIEKQVSSASPKSDASTDDKSSFTKAQTLQSKFLSEFSKALSQMQSMMNTYMAEWKAVYKERDTVYKQLIVAGMTNARKNGKNK